MIKIFNEDCLRTMEKMEDNSIDIIITSPPYNKAGYEGYIRKAHKQDTWIRNIEYAKDAQNDFMDEQKYQDWQIDVLNECWRILKPNGSIFYNHKIRMAKHKASHPIEWLLKTKFIFRQQLIWDRGSTPALAPIRFLPTTELIFWLTKTQTQPNFKRNKNAMFLKEVWSFNAKPNKTHPAPFPIELPLGILQHLDYTTDVVVYDPFMGVGTTMLAAKQMGLAAIGSEICGTYYETAKINLNL